MFLKITFVLVDTLLGDQEVYYVVRDNSPFSSVVKTYGERMRLSPESINLYYNDQLIPLNLTPKDLGMMKENETYVVFRK